LVSPPPHDLTERPRRPCELEEPTGHDDKSAAATQKQTLEENERIAAQLVGLKRDLTALSDQQQNLTALSDQLALIKHGLLHESRTSRIQSKPSALASSMPTRALMSYPRVCCLKKKRARIWGPSSACLSNG
jgi:hypothetical protein